MELKNKITLSKMYTNKYNMYALRPSINLKHSIRYEQVMNSY